MIVKKSIEVGKLPIIWKQANVTPIYKGGSKFEAVNYIPVSLTSIPCKIAEAVIVGNINNHMLTNDLFCKKQYGFMRNNVSDWCDVTSGIAQGSKIVPLCFNIFINDLPHMLRNLILLYADDSKIIVKLTDDELLNNTLQEDLNRLNNYCDKWSMKLNKCRVIRYKAKRKLNNLDREYYLFNADGIHNLKETLEL